MSTSVSRRASAPVHPTRQQLEELDALLKRMLDLPVGPAADETEEAAFAAPTGKEAPPAVSPPEPMRGPHPSTFARPIETQVPPAAVNYQTPDAEEADLQPRVVPAAPDAAPRDNAPAAPPPDKAEEKPQPGGDWVPLTSSWRPSARTWKPLSDAWQQAQVGTGGPVAPPPWVRDISAAPPPEPTTAPSAPPRQEAPPTAPPPAPMVSPALAEEPVAKRVAPSPRVVEQAKHWKPVLPSTTRRTPWTLWPLVGFNAAFDACLLPWGPLGRWLRGPTGRSLLGILGLLFLTAAASWAAAEWIGWTR